MGVPPLGYGGEAAGGKARERGPTKNFQECTPCHARCSRLVRKASLAVPNAHESEGAGKAPKQAGALSAERLVRSQADVMSG